MAVDTPAVVLGAGVNGLGVARSLARAGVPVWLLDSDAQRPEMRTHAAKPVTVRSLHGEILVEELVRLAAAQFSGLRPVLLLTQEESVKTVSHHRDRLSAIYRFSLPTIGMVDTLLHKQGFQSLAEQLGSPIPPLVHVGTLADLPGIEGLRYPVVIKPGERNTEYGHQFKKAYRVERATEGVELIRRILPVMADVVVQEWIEGPDSNIYFCLQYLGKQGQVAASFTGRKIRSWPPQVGGTASCVAAPEAHEELTAMTAQFFQAAGVIGMASMEYKRDSRSGEFRMVEPTVGRTDYQEEVATLNGINLPYAAWCSELDLPFSQAVMKGRPVVWRVRSEDMQSAAAQSQSAKQGYPRGGHVADALWRWRDPMPCLVQNWRRARSALHNRTSKLMGRVTSHREQAMSVVARFLPRRWTRRVLDPRSGLQAAAEWLARAQDASGCGGVSAAYDAAKRQWTGAYPETTGYIIPTFFRYAEFSGDDEYRQRAIRMATWESDIQFPEGGVRAGTMDATQIVPTIFNTGQVLFGWLSAWQQTQDARFRDSAVRAADWLVAAQDPDGAWRRFASPFAAHTVNTYNTRVAFALAKAGHDLHEPRYLDAAVRNVQWALTQMHTNGWLENNDLEDNDRPLTHTIAYATRGIFEVGVIADQSSFVDVATRIARAVAQNQRRDGALPGRLDSSWRAASRWTCVTGNAQMAIIWQRLAAETGDASWKAAAESAIRFNLSIQDLTTADVGVRGGVPGSHPRSGGYMKHRYPNWAAKFFMDALMLQLEAR